MATLAFAWLLFASGVACVAGLIALTISGARHERIAWADQALFGILAAIAAIVMSLYTLGYLTGIALAVRLGLYLGLFEAGTLLFVFLPLALWVVRSRKRKGWTASVAGKPPVSR